MTRKPPLHDEAVAARMARLHSLAEWMDAKWQIPGLKRRFGLDGLLGLIPGAGDAVSAAMAAYIVYEAHQMGVPLHVKLRMVWNVLVDMVIGAIPLLGDLFDFVWKANLKNTQLLNRHLAKRGQGVTK